MRKTSAGVLSVVMLFGVFCLFNVKAVSAAPLVTIKFQDVYPSTSDASLHLLFFVEKVHEYTNGEVEIKVFWPGQLIELKEGFSALQRGTIGGLLAAGFYYPGIMPEGNGDQLPYAWKDPGEDTDIYLNHGYLDLMREAAEKHGVRYVAPISAASCGLITKFPVNKLEDMKGKKIRASGMQGEVARALGASPVNLAMSEQYVALQRGTVDGIIFPFYALETHKLYEVTSYLTSPAFFTPSNLFILLNGEMWDKLSPDHKKAIDRAGMETMRRSFMSGELADSRAKKFIKEKGMKIIELSPKEAERFRKAAMTVYKSHAEKSDLCAKQVEIIKKYAAEKGK